MEKIRIKELIHFRRKSDRSKIFFANNLKNRKKPEQKSSEGGNYWVSCISAICNTFKWNDKSYLDKRILELNEKILKTENVRNRTQFQRNLDILLSIGDFDFQSIRPDNKLSFLGIPKSNTVINIKELPIQVVPHFVFLFSRNIEIGAIWFVAELKGYDDLELAMFGDILFRYLNFNYSNKYIVNKTYCIVVDVIKGKKISYEDIEKQNIPLLLDKTLDELTKLQK